MNINNRSTIKHTNIHPFPQQKIFLLESSQHFQQKNNCISSSAPISPSIMQNVQFQTKILNKYPRMAPNYIVSKQNMYPRFIQKENPKSIISIPQKVPFQINTNYINKSNIQNQQDPKKLIPIQNKYYKQHRHSQNQYCNNIPMKFEHKPNNMMTHSVIFPKKNPLEEKNLLTPQSKQFMKKYQCESVEQKPNIITSPLLQQSKSYKSLNIPGFLPDQNTIETYQTKFNNLAKQIELAKQDVIKITQNNRIPLRKSYSLFEQQSDMNIFSKLNINYHDQNKYQIKEFSNEDHSLREIIQDNNKQNIQYFNDIKSYPSITKFQSIQKINQSYLNQQKTSSFKKKTTFGRANQLRQQEKQEIYKSFSFERKNSTKKEIKLSDFQKGKLLGKGKFGEVYLAKHKQTGFLCALKVISKQLIKQQKVQNQIIRELKIQSYLKHPNIVNSYGFFADQQNIYVILQLCSGGHLYKKIKEKRRVSQDETVNLVKQVCQGLNYLHQQRILHRDLKPENIIIQNGIAKICDFGWAVFAGEGLRKTVCGTPLYLSPEIIKGEEYDQSTDIWAIGILTYEMIFGNIPFKIWTQLQLNKIVDDQVKFPDYVDISDTGKDFILKILQKDPKNRLSIEDLLNHNFLKKQLGDQNILIKEF